MTQTFSGGSNRMSRKSWGVMAAVVALAIVLALFNACTRDVSLMRTGDEPPIRVRGGSMKFELLNQAAAFEEDNSTDKKKWRIKGTPVRNRNKFLVVIVSGNPSCNGIVRSGDKIDIVYSDNQEVEFKSNANNTKITAKPEKLNQSSTELHTLTYGVSGSTTEYIRGIRIDSNTDYVCEFTAADAALQIFLLD